MERKGFPESYDRRALLSFLAQVKSGAPEVAAPRYSHLLYDIVPGEYNIIRQPDILVVEGLNVLQAARTAERGGTELVVSDFFDFSIYIDAAEQDLRQWYVERFLALRATAFNNPASYFHRYADMSSMQAAAYALEVWDRVNGPNLIHNIAPTRGRADLIMSKGHDHRVDELFLRKT
jgi:type I pantothenate kinase